MIPRTVLTLSAPLVLALSLSACQRSDGTSEIEAARKSAAAHDYKATVISAKAALQRNAESAEARLLLGQALLESGDPRAATVELRKAQELGASDGKVLPLLARSLLGEGEARQVVQQFGTTRLDDVTASAEVKTTVAAAHMALGARDAAQEAIASALQEAPRLASAKLLLARMKAADKNLPAAMATVDEVLAADPNDATALLLRGDLQRAQKQPDAALASYRASVAAKPDSVAAHAGVIELLLEMRKIEEAKAALSKLQGIAPQRPETQYFDAQLAFISGDFAKTRELTAQLLKARPDHPQVLFLAGMAEVRLNSWAPAESFLAQAVKAAPNASGPRQMLARVLMRSGQAQRALEALQPLLQGQATDAATLTLAGQASLLEGDTANADGFFARAAKLDPNDSTARTALALNKVARGNNEGFAELEAAAAADAQGTRADLALISARMRANDISGALKAIDALQKKEPDKPLAHVLRGKVLLLKKDSAGASASFEKAVQLDPLYFPATAALAAMDMAANKPDQARQRFESVLKADPKNMRALLAMAELKARSGAGKDDIVKTLTEASRANPSEAAPRLLLTRFLLTKGDTKGALAAAQDADAALPNNPDVLDALGSTQIAAGQAQQAVSTFGKLAALRPGRPEPEMRLAEAYVAVKDFDNAKRSLERALSTKPGLLPAQLALGRVLLVAGRFNEALQQAKVVQKADPKAPGGYILEADVETTRNKPDAAVAPLRAALPLGKGPEVAIYLHRSLTASGKREEADRLATDWRKDHPRDVAFRYYLADLALAKSDFPAAETLYRSVIEIQPDHALALNNVAWLMTKQQKPGAVAMAEKANQLLPEQAALMDTLAWAMANEQQASKAIDVQKKAIEKAPDNASLKLTLAKIYLKAGDRKQARNELDELAKLGDKFKGQSEVASLIKSM